MKIDIGNLIDYTAGGICYSVLGILGLVTYEGYTRDKEETERIKNFNYTSNTKGNILNKRI